MWMDEGLVWEGWGPIGKREFWASESGKSK